MADKAKTLLQKLHLKPSTTLKVSKTAVFILLGLVSVQTVAGGLLWYANRLKAAGGITQVGAFPQNKLHYELADDIAISPDGNVHVATDEQGAVTRPKIQETTNTGTVVRSWGEVPGDPEGVSPADLKVAFDSSNNAYVLDQANSRVIKFNSSRDYVLQWGSLGSGNGQFGSDGSDSSDILVDAAGNVWVMDSPNDRVQKFSNTGIYQLQFGSQGVGQGQFSESPMAFAADNNSNVYVADFSGATRVQKFASNGVYESTWTTNDFIGISSMAVDASNNLFVTGNNSNKITKYSLEGLLVTEWGSYCADPLVCANGQFTYSTRLGVDSSGNVYALDTGDYNARVQKFSNSGTYTTKWGNTQPGQFSIAPMSVITDTDGYRYVMDYGARRIQKFDSNNNYVTEFGGQFEFPDSYTQGKFYGGDLWSMLASDGTNNIYATNGTRIEKFSSAGTSLTSWLLPTNYLPYFIAASSDGNVYVLTIRIGDGLEPDIKIYRYSATGTLLGQWGSIGSGNGQFASPQGLGGIDVDSSGNVYVADSGNYRIQKFSPSGAYLSQWGSQGSGDSQFQAALGLSIDPQDRLYVFDGDVQTGAMVFKKFTTNGTFLTKANTDALGFDMEAEGSGSILVADMRGQVRVFQDNTSIEITTSSLPNGTRDQVYSQTVQTADSQGAVTFSVTSGSLPSGLVLNASTGEISGTPTIAGVYSFTIQASDSEASDSAALSITVLAYGRQVSTLAADSIAADTASLRGMVTVPAGMTSRGFEYGLTTSYGTSVLDSANLNYRASGSWGGYGTGDGQFMTAMDMAADDSDGIYAVDSSGYRVQKFNPVGDHQYNITENAPGGGLRQPFAVAASSNGTVAVMYNATYIGVYQASDGSSLGGFSIASATDVAMDASGNIYVADPDNCRVRIYTSAGSLSSEWGSCGAGPEQFTFASRIAVDQDNNYVYLTDYNPSAFIIKKYSTAGTYQALVGELAIGGNGPRVDVREGNLYAAEDLAATVDIYNAAGTLVQTVVTKDSPGPSQNINGLAVSSTGDLYFSGSYDYVYRWSGRIDANLTDLTCETTYHYRAFAADSNGTIYGNDATFTTSTCPDVPISIITTNLSEGTELTSYQDYINVENATGVVTYAVTTGALPDGLSLDSQTGYITGIPTQAGQYSFDITASDDNSQDTQSLQIIINQASSQDPPLQITTPSLADASWTYINGPEIGYQSYFEYVYTDNYIGNVSFSVIDGNLPPGLSLDSNQWYGTLSGTPTTAGTYTFTVQAQDSRGSGDGGTDTQQYTVVVPELPPINITSTTMDNARVGLPYNKTINYEYAQAQPVFSVVSGSLPDGMYLTLGGYVEGTPTQAGEYTFTVQADDGFSSDTQEYTLVVDPAPEPIVNTPFVTITSPGNNATFTGGNSLITGTGPANQTITLFVDNQQIGTTTANSEGNWAYTAQNIPPGNHTLDAKWIPGAEVMFVSKFDGDALSSQIDIIDTSSDTVIKTLVYDEMGAAVVAATVSPVGDYVYFGGVNVVNPGAFLLKLNLSTAEMEEFSVPGVDAVGPMTISQDGTQLFFASFDQATEGQGHRVLRFNTSSEAFVVQPGTLSGGSDIMHSLYLSEDESKLYVGTHNIYGYNYADDSSGTITVLDASTLETERTIGTLNNDSPGPFVPIETATSFTARNGIGYVGIAQRTTDAGGNLVGGEYGGTSIPLVRIINLSNGDFIADIGYNPEPSYGAVGAMYVDESSQYLYIRFYLQDHSGSSGMSKFRLGDSQLIAVNNFTEPPMPSDFTLLVNQGIEFANNKLYAPYFAGNSMQSAMEVLSSQDLSQASAGTNPILFGQYFAYSIGSNFIGSIIPPKDSIAFSVPTTSEPPNCQDTNSCPPVDCTTTNTCPPPDCTATNTCPKPPEPPACQQTGTCPTVTGPNTPNTPTITPTIVNTPLPNNLTPASSRLGWFDRSVLSLARFIPEQAAIGFPYLLFILMLIFALSLYYQSSNEIRKDALNKQFLAKRKSIRAQQDNFIALASHYLNTPITIIQGGVENEERKR